MGGDLATLASEATPYVTAAVSAYGGAVLAKIGDKAAEESVDAAAGVGRRVLQRIFGTRQQGEQVPSVLADVIADPQDAHYLGALRTAIREALAGDDALAGEVQAMMAEAASAGTVRVHAQAFGKAQQANQGQGVQNNTFGVRPGQP